MTLTHRNHDGCMSDFFSLEGKRVWIAGHRGLVGQSLLARLAHTSCDVLTVPRETLDLLDPLAVGAWLRAHKPDAIIVAAARVGGILANAKQPVDFLQDNLQIALSILQGAHRADVDRLVYLGSSCIYPRETAQPIEESALMTGPLEPTNAWYATAKIAGLKLTQAYRAQYGRHYIAAMPTNLYGPGDRFDLESGHVLPALMRKAHEAKRDGAPSVTLWGSGSAQREFLHAQDCVDALVHLLRHYDGAEPINIGSGDELTIQELATLVCDVVGFDGAITHDLSKPDGTPRKRLSTARLDAMGWRPRIPLRAGLEQTYAWFLDHYGR